ncbi:DUF4148 domain-containing protein [Comamonas composti]|uniref:DUF4148 domain-containing protein n=1 Tax=Comamonas composti TaxID=408558 RepID=UPI00042480E1|nr:DUF4148 domain-containing protein [Comamonas composti]
MRTLYSVLAVVALGVAGSAMAQQAEISTVSKAGLSRAEVQADLEMWHRAGMTYLPSASAVPEIVDSPAYQQSLERYQQLRQGPAYREAVAKLQSQGPVAGE